MEIRTRNVIKKIAAIGSGALMAATCFGVAGLATDLSDYPAPFVADGKWVGLIAVGSDAAAGDIIGATDIAATLAQVAGGTAGTTTVTGGKEKEVDLGTYLNATANFGTTALDDDDLAGLQDTAITIDIAEGDDDFDVSDQLKISGIGTDAASIQTGLTFAANQDEDFKEDAFMAIPKGSIGYYYVFDDAPTATVNLSGADDSYPIELDFLGKKLIITGTTATSVTAQVGEEFFMNTDDTVTVLGHTVKLINVGSAGAVVVSVDGTQETVSGVEKVGTMRIKVKETFYSDTKAERSATLVIGEDATKTYDNDDPYIGEDEDDPNWVWDLAGVNGLTPTIGITWDQVYDDPEEVIAIGGSFALPNNYVTIKPTAYTVNDYQTYTIGTESGITLSYNNGTGGDFKTSAKAVHIEASGGSDDGLKVSTYETDDIYLYLDTVTNDTIVFYKDTDDNKIKDALTYFNTTGDDKFTLEYQDSSIGVDGVINASGQLTLTIDEQNNDGTTNNLNLFLQPVGWAAADLYYGYIGHSDGDTVTASDLTYGTKDISGWEENTRTQKGLIVHSYDASASSDEFVFEVPSDTADMAVNVLISSSGTKTTVTGGAGTMSGVPVAKLDTEITDAKAQNLILVGGTAVNKLTAEALGLTYPTYGTDASVATGIGAGEATLKLVENAFGGTNTALIVAGWEAADTRAAANVLKDYSAYSATLTGKQVIVKSTAGTITLSAPTVAAPAPVLPETNETV